MSKTNDSVTDTSGSKDIVFAPASKAQEQFLTSTADVTFYGGGLSASV